MLYLKPVQKLTLSALFLAAGLVLPFLTGQIQFIGNMLCPMHMPVLLCGLICGWKYGLVVGAIMPLLRSAMFSMPPMMPQAVAMAFELAAYGAISGWLYQIQKKQSIVSVYTSLLGAMIGGRIIWGVVMAVLMGLSGSAFTLSAFIAGAFSNAIPGIILQLTAIPLLMVVLDKTGVLRFERPAASQKAAVSAAKAEA